MVTAAILLNDVLQEILVQAAEQPIQTVDFQTSKRYLNYFMADMAANGIALGYTEVINPNDPITVPDGSLLGIIKNLAVKLSTQYDVQVGPILFEEAKAGILTMRKIARVSRRTVLPSILPVGRANECWGSDRHFFPCEDDSILTEQNGRILLESNNND